MTKLRLTFEMIPASSWKINLRNILPREKWKYIRKEVIVKSKGECMICREKTVLDCHEVWKYKDANHTQKLVGFLALCKKCHAVKHIGYSSLSEDKIGYSMDTLIRHFMKVNKCDRITFNKYYRETMNIWRKRSRFDWIVISNNH